MPDRLFFGSGTDVSPIDFLIYCGVDVEKAAVCLFNFFMGRDVDDEIYRYIFDYLTVCYGHERYMQIDGDGDYTVLRYFRG